MSKKRTLDAIRKIPAWNGFRDSCYCPNCGTNSGSGLGNHSYSWERSYQWFTCSKCKADYDLRVYNHRLPNDGKSRPPLGSEGGLTFGVRRGGGKRK